MPNRHFVNHHEHAGKIAQHLHGDLRHDHDPESRIGAGIILALLAIAQATRAEALEVRRIRKLLEAQVPASQGTVRLHLTGSLVPKHGGLPVPLSFTPDETQDVQLAIAPVNTAGSPTTGPFTWTASSNSDALTVAADGLSAKFVTPAGDLDVIVSVSDPRTSVSDVARITRTAPPPPDNNTTNLNLSGAVVSKAA